jgi:hypothetical protein
MPINYNPLQNASCDVRGSVKIRGIFYAKKHKNYVVNFCFKSKKIKIRKCFKDFFEAVCFRKSLEHQYNFVFLTLEEKLKLKKQRKAESDKNYRIKNIEKLRNYDHSRKSRLTLYAKNRIEKDVNFKIIKNLRSLLYQKHNQHNLKKNTKSTDILGCTWEVFFTHIELQFEPWMNKNNQGKYLKNGPKTWCIDHIIPIACGRTLQEKIMLMHYTNCRPYCSYKNIVEGDRRKITDAELNAYFLKVNLYIFKR